MQNTSDQLKMFDTSSEQSGSTSETTQALNSQSLSDRLARILVWLEKEKGLKDLNHPLSNMPSFLSNGLDLTFLSGRMLKGRTPQMMARIIGQLSKPLPTLMVIDTNSNCLILHGFYPKIESGFTLSDILQKDVEERYFLSPKMLNYVLNKTGGGKPRVINCLDANYAKGWLDHGQRTHLISGTLSAGGNSGGLHSQMTLIKSNTVNGFEIAEEGDSINLSNPNSKTRRGRVGKAQTLDTQSNQAVIIGIHRTHFDGRGLREMKENICPTIPARDPSRGAPIIMEKKTIRRLTEIECERLQGFPDDHTKFGDYDGVIKEIPKTQRYKLLGNAVTVAVVKEVGKRIFKAIDQYEKTK